MIGIKSIVYEQNDKRFMIHIDNNESEILYNDITKKIDNKWIFNYLESLFGIIFEWKQEYINGAIIDGDYWNLSIIDVNGNTKEYCGKADFPNNFEALIRLNQKLIEMVQNG